MEPDDEDAKRLHLTDRWESHFPLTNCVRKGMGGMSSRVGMDRRNVAQIKSFVCSATALSDMEAEMVRLTYSLFNEPVPFNIDDLDAFDTAIEEAQECLSRIHHQVARARVSK